MNTYKKGGKHMKKTYTKPVVSSKGKTDVTVSMGCSSGGTGRSHCLRA